MSAFGGLILTNRGRNLQAKTQAGAELKYTRIALGDGSLGNTPIADLTALKNLVMYLAIHKLKVLTEGRVLIGTVLSNQELNTGFYFRELGIFALDPDLGEVLYCYGNSGSLAEYIPAGGGPDIIEKSIDIQTLIGNTKNVSAVIDNSLVYATENELRKVENSLRQSIDNIEVPVISVNSKTGAVVLSAADVGAISQSDFNSSMSNKVDKESGKRLMTDAEGTKLAGIPNDVVNAIAMSPINSDPNITTVPFILTDHENSPKKLTYWYVQTYFYGSKSGSRAQLAIKYTGSGDNAIQMYMRSCYSNVWTPWIEMYHRGNLNVADANISEDPNTTTSPLIATNHANAPSTSIYWYIQTNFYVNKVKEKSQIAISFSQNVVEVYVRTYFNNVWSSWKKIAMSSDLSRAIPFGTQNFLTPSGIYGDNTRLDPNKTIELTIANISGSVGNSYISGVYRNSNFGLGVKSLKYKIRADQNGTMTVRPKITFKDIQTQAVLHTVFGTTRNATTTETAYEDIFPNAIYADKPCDISLSLVITTNGSGGATLYNPGFTEAIVTRYLIPEN